MMKRLVIDVRPDRYAVARWPGDTPVPPGLLDAPGLVSVARTEEELSVVCREADMPTDPAAEQQETGWRALTARGPLAFTLTGIMAAISGALAGAGVSLFALSTYDTDHVLVKETDLGRAIDALREAGLEVHDG
jgi:uncharacterized protein